MILVAILSLTPPDLVYESTQQTHASHAGHDMTYGGAHPNGAMVFVQFYAGI
jgi:hypothetical protein